MKKYFSGKFGDIRVSEALKDARKKVEKLLPESAPRLAGQLPLPGTPFDHYRRRKLIRVLRFERYVGGRSVLEIGCGIGDLLLEMSRFGPKELYGVDSSSEVLDFARQYLAGVNVDLTLADPRKLPFPEKSFDVVIVMYELQHIFNGKEVQEVVNEATRVARQWVILVEETAPETYRKDNIIRRPVKYYKEAFLNANRDVEVLCNAKDRRFHLRQTDYLHVRASQFVFTGTGNPWHWFRWLISPLLYLMGFPAKYMKLPTKQSDLPTSKLAIALQKWALPFTSWFDGIYQTNDGTTVMWFERERLFRRG